MLTAVLLMPMQDQADNRLLTGLWEISVSKLNVCHTFRVCHDSKIILSWVSPSFFSIRMTA